MLSVPVLELLLVLLPLLVLVNTAAATTTITTTTTTIAATITTANTKISTPVFGNALAVSTIIIQTHNSHLANSIYSLYLLDRECPSANPDRSWPTDYDVSMSIIHYTLRLYTILIKAHTYKQAHTSKGHWCLCRNEGNGNIDFIIDAAEFFDNALLLPIEMLSTSSAAVATSALSSPSFSLSLSFLPLALLLPIEGDFCGRVSASSQVTISTALSMC